MRLRTKRDRPRDIHTHAQTHREAEATSKVRSDSMRGRVTGGSEKSQHCHTERARERVQKLERTRASERERERMSGVQDTEESWEGNVGKNQTQSN